MEHLSFFGISLYIPNLLILIVSLISVEAVVRSGGEETGSSSTGSSSTCLRQETEHAAKCLVGVGALSTASAIAFDQTEPIIGLNITNFPSFHHNVDSGRFALNMEINGGELPKGTSDLFDIKCVLESHLRKIRIERVERSETGIRVELSGARR